MIHKILRSVLLLGVFCAVSTATLFAQNSTIKGTVTDANTGESLPSVNVFINELQRGSATNIDGEFEIEDVAYGTYTLRVSFVGFETYEQTITVDEPTVEVNVELIPDTQLLEEVVVTAFGVQREERSLGYSQQRVSSEELANNEQTNFISNLQGKVAGVQITDGQGVGGSSRILLRGTSSLSGDNQPLFVVDGVYIDNSNLGSAGEFGGIDYGNAAMDINPENIESLTVLKGPNAAALYGSRAANGAIVITTKSGSSSREGIGVTINSSLRFSDVLKLPDLQNKYGQGSNFQFQYVDGAGGGVNDGTDESWGPPLDGTPRVQWWTNGKKEPWVAHPNNIENYFETGLRFNNSVSVAGNYENTNYRLSLSNLQENGTIPNSSLERNNVTLSAGADLSDDLRAQGKVTYIQSLGNNRAGLGYSSQNPMQSITQWFGRQVDMKKLKDYTHPDGTPRNWNYNYHDNPYWLQYENGNRQQRDRIIGNVSLTYDITDWLSVKGFTGNDFYQDRRKNWIAKGSINNPSGMYSEDVYFVNQWTSNVILSGKRDITQDINLDVRLGAESTQRNFDRNYGQAPALSVPNVYSLENSAVRQNITDYTSKKQVNSLFGTLTLGYQDFVYLDVTGRNDWSSTLPEDNNSYFYPSATLSFIFSDAFSMPEDILTYGKVRASWTQVGSDTDPYQLQSTYISTDPFGDIPTYTVQNRLPNASLKPEQTESVEFGADLRFLKDRLRLDATYYDQSTTDQILGVQISRASGYDETIVNAGEVRNSGVELTLAGTPVQTRDMRWDITLNWAKNKNEVIALTEGLDSYIIGSSWDVTVEARPGEEFGSLYGTAFKRDEDGNILTSGGMPLTADEQKNFGSYQPDWTGSISSEFSYKNFNFSFLVDTKQGGVLSSVTDMFGRYTGIMAETAKTPREDGIVFGGGRWADQAIDINTGKPNTIEVPAQSYYTGSSFGLTESHIFDASYIKLRQVRLSYSLPVNWLSPTPIRRATVAIVGNNLWIIKDEVPHIDPETAFNTGNLQGLESNQLPSTRSFGFSVSLSL